MRFGKWRVAPLTMTFAALLGLAVASTVRADGWRLHPTLPREVPAYDFTTGGEYFAPPVPYGHYAKDPHGAAAKALGHLYGPLGHLKGMFHHGGHGGEGCGGGDGCGHGLGNGCGHGLGNGCGHGLGGLGCGFCAGRGLFHGGLGDGCGLLGGKGHGHKKSFAPCHASTVVATAQSQPSAQAVVAPSGQSACGTPGCGIGGIHSHLANLKNKIACKLCGGRGLGCGGCGGMGFGDPCGKCGGAGLLGGLGHGRACGGCGGCGLMGHGMGKLHGMLGHLAGSAMGMLHHNKFDWFVGPGGPVPLTPGYVPYIVTTRSPRDFFAFPPMNPDVP